jgi:hypothetical protein
VLQVEVSWQYQIMFFIKEIKEQLGGLLIELLQFISSMG